MGQIAYLDNSSTTKPCKKAIDYITNSLENNWGNPSSLHKIGIEAEMAITDARTLAAKSIHARADEIIFTGSGTEANNTALLSLLSKRKRGGRIITTSIEHPSILETVKRLESEGFTVIRLKPNDTGVISLKDLEENLTSDTVFVSVMLVNNETGAIQPVADIAKLVKRVAPTAVVHSDAVQGYGKIPINVNTLGVDMLSVSGHKIHGPKGIGFLFKKKSLNLSPLITGGGQEMGLRSGTESLPLIMGLKGAIQELPSLDLQHKKQQELIDYSIKSLTKLKNVVINSPKDALPYILNISVLGYRSEILLHFLESKDVYVSSGSACAKGNGSYVLNEMGLDKKRVDSALRISFSRFNTLEDIDKLCAALAEAEKQIRKAY